MPERQSRAKTAYEMADRLQRSADVPRWNKSERQTIEEWAEDQEITFAQAIRRLGELGLKGEVSARSARGREKAMGQGSTWTSKDGDLLRALAHSGQNSAAMMRVD